MTELKRTFAGFAVATKGGFAFAFSGALLVGCGGVSSFAPSDAGVMSIAHPPAKKQAKTFYYTGDVQNFTVPRGVKHVTITAIGAPTKSAHSGLVNGTIPVTPGESLAVFVGGGPNGGAGGYNGGGDGGVGAVGTGNGGGGASDVRQGGSEIADRVIVASGGGGRGAYRGGDSGPGGALVGGRGVQGHSGNAPSGSYTGGGGGRGGTQSKGGVGGKPGDASESGWTGAQGADGVLGDGGGGG